MGDRAAAPAGATESTFDLASGRIAALSWGDPEAPPLVAIHGWLDNAASFNAIAPLLSERFHVLALDLPGHGHSAHRPAGESYELLDYVRDLALLVEGQLAQPVTLVGHSLGGIVASLLAASRPGWVDQLIMIDSLGPMVGEPEAFPGQLGKALERMVNGSRGEPPSYASLDEAVQARMGGRIPLTREAAAHIVPRNLHDQGPPWQWRTDPRLRYPSMHKLEEAEVQACLKAIECRALVVRASQGLLAYAQDMTGRRLGLMSRETLLEFEGGHHCHLDGDCSQLASACLEWLEPNRPD